MKEEIFTDTRKYKLPVSVEACMDHICSMLLPGSMTTREIDIIGNTIEETYDFIEKQIGLYEENKK